MIAFYQKRHSVDSSTNQMSSGRSSRFTSGLTPVEEAFVWKMEELSKKNVDFGEVASETLREVLGDTPSQVLYMMLGGAAMKRPPLFARGLSRIFGEGAVAIFNAIAMHADGDGHGRNGESQPSRYESIVQKLGTPSSKENRKASYLHDHRLKEDWDDILERRKRQE